MYIILNSQSAEKVRVNVNYIECYYKLGNLSKIILNSGREMSVRESVETIDSMINLNIALDEK